VKKIMISLGYLFFAVSPAKADDFICLVEAIYHEARSESITGMVAVANVILSRTASKKYPDNICGVVHQGKYWEGNPVRNRCQFSYWCDGRTEKYRDIAALKKSITVAEMSLIGLQVKQTVNATHYHAAYVAPKWASSSRFVRLGQIGKHIFYLDKGN